MDRSVAIVADPAQSALDRLRVKAKKTGKSFQLILQLFCQEEFFRRLESSSYQNNLILKGGLLIYSLSGFESRPTQDVDFLMRNHPNTESMVGKMMKSILSTPTQQSYIQFQVTGTSLIAEHREYNGVRVKLQAMIKNTRTPLQVDIGIGDVVIPKPVLRSIPVQLEGFDCPKVYAYSYESVIAEKWDAMITRMELTSRMKDFFDVYYLASHHDFDGRVLKEALFETLQKRGTPIDQVQL
jgi:predicted nucleotidyltransferase component of viral defense system